MNWTTLVEAGTLARSLDHQDLRLFDARFSLADPRAGRAAYQAAHLPGAVHADLDADLADLSLQGQGRHPLPDEDVFTMRLGEWGVTPASQVVVYDAGDGAMAAARMWWLLKLLGHERVAVLDGGLERWNTLGLPVTTQCPERHPTASYPGRFDRSRIATADEVLSGLRSDQAFLLDARAAPRFAGEIEPIDAVAGHVPGAINRPYAESLRGGVFKPADELHTELGALLQERPATEAVLMCGSGVTACHLLLALEHAGLHGARVYAGSWSGWIEDPSRPVATGAA